MPGLHNGTGGRRIQAERIRQIQEEGWSLEHDDDHAFGDLAWAGNLYSLNSVRADTPVPDSWPWKKQSWKPTDDRVRNLEKAGALVQAEIDKLIRLRHDIADEINELLAEGPDVQIR